MTRRCNNACGYCRYPYGPRKPLPPKKTLQKEFVRARQLGAAQIELISGEGLERVNDVRRGLRYMGFRSYVQYLDEVLAQLEETAGQLLPLLNVGILSKTNLEILRARLCVVQIFLESLDPQVQQGIAHANAPAKDPERRMEMILNCGRLDIPVATGSMIGIGEDDSSQLRTMEVLSQVCERYRHIQSFEIQTFWPREDTPMAQHPPVDDDELLNVTLMARDLLPPEVAIIVKGQEHPALIGELLDAGVNDLGVISARLNKEDDPRSWQNILRKAEHACRERDLFLAPRVTLASVFQDPKYFPAGYPDRLSRALAEFSTDIPRTEQMGVKPLS